MSDHIPAWKRIGLKVKQVLSEDPLALTNHVDSAGTTSKQAKKLIQQRKRTETVARLADGTPATKTAKRVKLPKAERAPPPERDQLVYLRLYKEDKTNWKFSKQKQNWVLKNMKHIPESYDEALTDYLQGLQGGSRDRVTADLKVELEKWTKLAEATDKALEEADPSTEEPKAEVKVADEAKKTKTKAKAAPVEPKEEVPTFEWAVKARALYKAISGQEYFLKGIDDMHDETSELKEAEAPEKSEVTTESETTDAKVTEGTASTAVQRNLDVETVEVNDFITVEDTVDPAVKATGSEEAIVVETKVVPTKKAKKAKKAKSPKA